MKRTLSERFSERLSIDIANGCRTLMRTLSLRALELELELGGESHERVSTEYRPVSYGSTGGGYQTGKDETSCLGFLRREDERRLRAKAWRHVRRINPRIARAIWIRHRKAEPAMRAAA